jgi:magnesium and cobalt transporter
MFRAGLGNLRSLRVEDVAIPSVEITAVPVDITREALIEVFRESGYTRLPVYDGTLDNPLGLVHLKDLALRFGFDCTDGDFDLRALIRSLIFAPPSMPIGVLLGKMQSSRIHMALVIDEYGGVDGLLTIEDLIEQVLGEIEDEHDQEEGSLFTEEKPGCWLASARTPLDQFEAALGTHLAAPEDQEEIDTLGGLVFMLTGRVPARGEVIPHPDGLEFEVIDADARHIKRLRVRRASAAVLPGPGTEEVRAARSPIDSGQVPKGIRVDAAE